MALLRTHELEAWMREARARLSRHADVAKALDYMLVRWESFARLPVGKEPIGNLWGRRCLNY